MVVDTMSPDDRPSNLIARLKAAFDPRSLTLWIAVYAAIGLIIYAIRGWSTGIAAASLVLVGCVALVALTRRWGQDSRK